MGAEVEPGNVWTGAAPAAWDGVTTHEAELFLFLLVNLRPARGGKIAHCFHFFRFEIRW